MAMMRPSQSGHMCKGNDEHEFGLDSRDAPETLSRAKSVTSHPLPQKGLFRPCGPSIRTCGGNNPARLMVLEELRDRHKQHRMVGTSRAAISMSTAQRSWPACEC